jgi:hypothetical protein
MRYWADEDSDFDRKLVERASTDGADEIVSEVAISKRLCSKEPSAGRACLIVGPYMHKSPTFPLLRFSPSQPIILIAVLVNTIGDFM